MPRPASLLSALLFASIGLPDALAAEGRIRFTTFEGDGSTPVPCRIHLRDAKGAPVVPKSLPTWRDHFVCTGIADFPVSPGEYTYEIDRGPEYHIAFGEFSLADGLTVEQTNRLRRLVDLRREGWWSGETHVHRAPKDVELLMRAEDLHFAPAITWWNNANAWPQEPAGDAPRTFDSDRWYQLTGGEDERGGGALLYFHLPSPLPITGAAREWPSPMKFLELARTHPSAWIEIEKPFWLDTPIWLASGRVDSVGLAHNHMHRGGALDNEAWGRARDRTRYPGPRGNGFYTQDLYYRILDAGQRIPPSAGSASGVLPNPVGYNRAYVHLDGPPSWSGWWENLKAGRVFVSNGPLLRVRANGKLPGEVFRSPGGQPIQVELAATLDSRDPVSTIEVLHNGRVVRTVPSASLARGGSLGSLELGESGWFLVRAVADVPHTFRFASTGPFYVEVGDHPRRVSRAAVRFFLEWLRERSAGLKLEEATQRDEVLATHDTARRFWEARLAEANAE